jgi:hypothetical protein
VDRSIRRCLVREASTGVVTIPLSIRIAKVKNMLTSEVHHNTERNKIPLTEEAGTITGDQNTLVLTGCEIENTYNYVDSTSLSIGRCNTHLSNENRVHLKAT